jgi:hypothetical protein
MKGTLDTKALPVCRVAREVSRMPIATSLPPPIDPDGTGSRPSAERDQSELASDKRTQNLRLLTDELITLRRGREDLTERFPEGKRLVLLLHGFVVDGVWTESCISPGVGLVVARGNDNVISF